MAGAGYKLFNTGDVLTAAQVNTYLMEQSVMVFADAAARTTALSGVVAEGMLSYLKDTNAVEVYDGANWVASDDPNAIQNTIVDAKGDLIAASADNVPAVLAVGNNGETLVADSSVSVGLRYQEPKAGNPVINSAFQVWQRGTSISVSASSGTVYTADRWATSTSANQACTVSRQVTNDTTNLPNIQYCARFQRNSGQTGTTAIAFANVFESINSIPFAGKTVTLSFYARKGADYSASSSILQSYLLSGTGTDQNPLAAAYTGSNASIVANNTLTATWQRFSVTGTLPTTATEISAYMVFTPVGTASTNDYYEITGVQIEVGSVATPFKTQGVTLAGELAACQRYYFRTTATAQYQPMGSISLATSTNLIDYYFTYPTTMRTKPSSLDYSSPRFYDPVSANVYSGGTVVLQEATANVAQLRYTHTASNVTTGRGLLSLNDASNGYYGFSAEL